MTIEVCQSDLRGTRPVKGQTLVTKHRYFQGMSDARVSIH